MRNLIRILIVFLFILPISKSLAHEKVANSPCNLFINSVIDNYDSIKDHYWMGYSDPLYGFTLEETWDPNTSWISDEGKETLGDEVLKRDEDGNIFILNIYPSYVSKVNLRSGDKIIKINGIKTKNYSDKEIHNFFDDKETSVEITYINQLDEEITESLKLVEEFVVTKYLDFKIKNFNSLNNQNFEADFIIEYEIEAELYDGITKSDYTDMDNDNFFKLLKENFYNKNEENEEWYGSCYYTNEELNQMQIASPGWDFGLLNLSYKSEDTSEYSTYFDIHDEISGFDYEGYYITSKFDGQVKIKNNFDLRNFPFDKQRIVFSFSELQDPDIYLSVEWSTYANLHDIKNKENFINGWKVVDYRVLANNYQEQGFYKDKFLNGINIVLEIERESSYYVYKIILPIILILMVCWSVIWITPKEIESRLTVTIVCLLSLIAYNFVIDKEIPKLEYLTTMDWIIFTSYVFATIPNFLCIISFKLFTTNKKLCMTIENKAKYLGPISYIVIILLIITYNVSLEPDNSVQALRLLSK